MFGPHMPNTLLSYRYSSLSNSVRSVLTALAYLSFYLLFREQNLQQMRGFGNNFKFPEGSGSTSSTTAPTTSTRENMKIGLDSLLTEIIKS